MTWELYSWGSIIASYSDNGNEPSVFTQLWLTLFVFNSGAMHRVLLLLGSLNLSSDKENEPSHYEILAIQIAMANSSD